MRWGGFALAVLAAYLCQTAVLSFFGPHHFDTFLVLALLCALLAPTHEARIAAWTAGLIQDFGSADALGLHALALGLTALLFTRMREFFNVRVWWTRLGVAFLAAWPGQLLVLLHVYYWAGRGDAALSGLIGDAALTALLAAAAAALIAGLPWLAVQHRRRFRALRDTR